MRRFKGCMADGTENVVGIIAATRRVLALHERRSRLSCSHPPYTLHTT